MKGEKFWYWLHGYDIPHIETNTCMVGHSRVLDIELRVPEKARLMTRCLLVKATMRLRRKGFHAGTISLGVRMVDGRKWESAARFPAAQDFFTFMGHLDDLWTAMTLEYFGKTPDQMPNRIIIKKVSVILHSLEAACTITNDLVNTESANTHKLMTNRE